MSNSNAPGRANAVALKVEKGVFGIGKWIWSGMAIVVLMLGGSQAVQASTPATPSVPATVETPNDPPVAAPGQAVTQLPNGSWMLTGGTIGGQVSDTITVQAGSEGGAFSASLIYARSGHSATVLPNGSVFIFGGIGPDGRLVETAELINPASGSVEALNVPGLTARADHTATLLTDGQVLIAGGEDAELHALSNAQLWNPMAGSMPSESSLQIARYAHEAQLLAGGEGLVWGGLDSTGQRVPNGEIFNPGTKLFEGPVRSADSRILAQAAAAEQPPSVADSVPGADAVDVALDAVLGIRFSKPLPIAQLNATNLVLVGPGGMVSGSVNGAERGMLAFFTPDQELEPATTYTLFITGLSDEFGRVLPSASVRFTTLRIVPPAAAQVLDAGRTIPGTPSTKTSSVASSVANSKAGAQGSAASRSMPAVPPRNLIPPQPTASDVAEDWIPRLENRHGAWRVLGMANDPPLMPSVTSVNSMSTQSNTTAIAGRVLRLNGLPLVGVRISAGARSTASDSEGRFLLSGVAAGAQKIQVDGTAVFSSGRHYTEHFIQVEASSGRVTTLAAPIYLPRVDPATEVAISSPADHEIVLTHPAMPGLEVHIPKGAVIREQGGKIVTRVSLTPIPVDRAPYPSPVPFSVYFTLQPGGAYVDGVLTGVQF